MEVKFYRCKVCGKIIAMVNETAVNTICCGESMTLLKAGEVDAAVEKHVPVYETIGNRVKVTVGSVIHPMTEEHYIQWICLKTKEGIQFKELSPSSSPEAEFYISENDSVEEVYEYCNLHGLWVNK